MAQRPRFVAEHEVSGVLSESRLPACHLTVDLTGGPTTPLSSRQLPHAPEHPVATLSASERRAINLTWAKPFDGNSPLIRYILEMSENSKSPSTPQPGRAGLSHGVPAPMSRASASGQTLPSGASAASAVT